MSLLEKARGISSEKPNDITYILGPPGSGKTTLAGTFPKPMLYIQIGSDGGSVVLKNYTDEEVRTISLDKEDYSVSGSKHSYSKLMPILNELGQGNHNYKTVVIDAYSSIEEELVEFLMVKKNSRLSFDERSDINKLLINMRDKIVELSRKGVGYVLVSHTKNAEITDTLTGQKIVKIIPKGTENNGKLMLERAHTVVYCAKKAVKQKDDSIGVEFVTYVGAHPNIDTKLRMSTPLEGVGYYVQNLTYDKLMNIMNEADVAEVIEEVDGFVEANPFE